MAVTWSVNQTCAWLETQGLGQYRAAFEANEVAGNVLLDLGLDDLDYLQVKILAHRKKLLTGVAELRKDGAAATVMPPARKAQPSPRKPRVAASGRDAAQASLGVDGSAYETLPPTPPAATTRVGGHAVTKADPKLLHWSALKPLADSSAKAGQVAMVNSADAAAATLAEAGGDTTWDPLAALGGDSAGGSSLLSGEYDEEAERREFQAAVAAWRSGGQAASSSSTQEEDRPKLDPSETLFNGQLDEDAEQLAFKRAVDQWRTGAASAPPPKATPPLPAAAHAGRRGPLTSSNAKSEGVGGGAEIRSSKLIAQDLAKHLDDLHSANADALAARKAKAADELKVAMQNAAVAPAPTTEDNLDQGDDVPDTPRYHTPRCPADDLDPLTDESDVEDDDDDEPLLTSTATVALVDTHLGCVDTAADSADYTVEEEDDD